MTRSKYWLFCSFLCCIIGFIRLEAQNTEVPYQDLSHESRVFKHPKSYRLYLPAGYKDSGKRYPVIYFFHGWGGRHFKDDNALLDYVRIGELVDKHQVILVMWDGNMEETEPRPYNIGNHKDIRYQVQMKDYFPELVTHIDSSYRTIADRIHRGIIGFSMGGIMSFFLAGTYPDLVCAAVNLAGSPEFFIGYPENHTLFPVRYTFKNLADVQTRQHGGDSDILVYLNEEVRKGAEWEGNPYEFWGFHGGHGIDKPGEVMAFGMAVKFLTDAFVRNLPLKAKWSHYDLYDRFSIWGYQVVSNKEVPGFLFLRNVDRHGFGFYCPRWLPDGPGNRDVQATITTSPQYNPATTYHLIQCSADGENLHTGHITSDSAGYISVTLDGKGNEIGIYNDKDEPDFIVLNYTTATHERYLVPGSDNQLIIKLFNRGGEILASQKIRVAFQRGDTAVKVVQNKLTADVLPGQRIVTLPPLDVICFKKPPEHGEPFQVKFRISMETDSILSGDEIVVPVLFEAPRFDNLKIDDGLLIRGVAYGTGNGNGQAEAGEKIMVYKDEHRLRLFTDDPWVIDPEERLADEQIPAVWEDGFTLSSIVAISEECPDGHEIEFTGNFETLTNNPIERNVHWGKVRIRVENRKLSHPALSSSNGPIRYIAHRGESGTAPENTLAAFSLAWERAADAVELDIHLSKDNRIMVIHDNTTKRTAGTDFKISETDSETLRKLDVGVFKDSIYKGEKIPFLEEAIDLIPPGKKLVVEIKSGADVLPWLEKCIKSSSKADQLVFIAFDWQVIVDARKMFPGNPCYWLSSNKSDVLAKLDLAASAQLSGLDLYFPLIDEDLMQKARDLNLEIMAWTVDNPVEAKRLANLGVKSITTNRTEWLRKQLTE